MDPRLVNLIARQQAANFPGLSGSEIQATLRISADLLNEAIAANVASGAFLRELTVEPRGGNHLGIRIKLAKPAFLPTFSLTLLIERQPQLPADPVLVMKLSGVAGMIGLAAPAITSFKVLPPGVRLEGDRVLIDLRTLLQRYGQTALLDHAEQLQVTTEEGRLILLVHARVRPSS